MFSPIYLAPAKLNLFLHITGRRADGYHLLQSVFMLLDWCDELRFRINKTGLISRSDVFAQPHAASLPSDDLCTRAARALQQATGCQLGVDIALNKQLPSEAGMGGGSSDAATCLLALNQLWQLQLQPEELAAIGVQIGADVPFFLFGQNAWVEGIGDELQPIQLPAADFLIIKPEHGVSTQAIFSHPDLKRDEKQAIISVFAESPYEFGHNTMQTIAQALNPEIAQILAIMRDYGLNGRMTGSGSAVFAKLEAQHAPESLVQSLPPGWIAKRVSNLQQHPFWAM